MMTERRSRPVGNRAAKRVDGTTDNLTPTVTDPGYQPPIIALRHSRCSWEVLATDRQRQRMETALGIRFVDLDQLWCRVDADRQQLELAAELADARIMIDTGCRVAQLRTVARLRAPRDPWIAAQLRDFADLLEEVV